MQKIEENDCTLLEIKGIGKSSYNDNFNLLRLILSFGFRLLIKIVHKSASVFTNSIQKLLSNTLYAKDGFNTYNLKNIEKALIPCAHRFSIPDTFLILVVWRKVNFSEQLTLGITL